MHDAFGTPAGLAAQLVALGASRSPGVVADFAAGEGALLVAAHKRWPRAMLLGNDIDRGRANHLRRQFPTAAVAACDFVNSQHLSSRSSLSPYRGSVDVALLNPPFSDRGGHARHAVRIAGRDVKATRSLSFLLQSLAWLKPRGEVLAILPAGAMTSGRDREARMTLRAHGCLEFEISEQDDHFQGCRVRVALVRFRRGARKRSQHEAVVEVQRDVSDGSVKVFRGQVNATNASPGSRKMIHTTALRDFRVDGPLLSCDQGMLHSGPLLLLPRVGKPQVDKVAIWTGGAVVLSDCIIAISGRNLAQLTELHSIFKERFLEFAKLYGGSCAPYITLGRVEAFLNRPRLTGVGRDSPAEGSYAVMSA